MAVSYIPPGVQVDEIVSPSSSAVLAAPANICLIGLTQGYETKTAQIAFSADLASVDAFATAQTTWAPPANLTATAVATGGTFAANTYYWKVVAITSGGDTIGSNEATAVIVNNGSANLAWTATPGATGYRVYRATSTGGQITSPALVASIGNVLVYVDTGSAVGAGRVQVTPGGTQVTFANALGANDGTLATVKPLISQNEVQTITTTGTPAGGTFTLTFNGATTGPLVFNESAANIQTALRALSTIGAAEVTCTVGPLPTGVVCTFGGLLANKDLPLITHTDSLTGGASPAVVVTETTKGSNGGSSQLTLSGFNVAAGDSNDLHKLKLWYQTVPGTGDTFTIAYTPLGLTEVVVHSDATARNFLTTPESIDVSSLTQGQLAGMTVRFTSANVTPATSGTLTVDAADLQLDYQGTQTLTVPTGGSFQSVSGTFVSATDAIDPTKGTGGMPGGYVYGVDYTAVVAVDKHSVAISPVAGAILDTAGGTVNFVYRYVADNYYVPTRLTTSAEVQSRYGDAYNTPPTTVKTTVSYAAGLAFENGASNVVIQPLFSGSTSAKTQPTDGLSTADWALTLQNLRDYDDINIIVPVIDNGTSAATTVAIFQLIQDHQSFMQGEGQYIINIFGEDSTGSTVNGTSSVLQTHAGTLGQRYGGLLAEANVLVSPSKYDHPLPRDNSNVSIGGQYAAAAIAGMLASRPVTSPLTRKQLSGIVAVGETRNRSEKNAEAAAGLMVLEQKGRAVVVRHAITLDTTNIAARELSVVRAKHNLIESVRTTVDNALPIVSNGTAATTVKMLVIAVLEQLRAAREIVGYKDVQSRLLTGDPTTAEVRFSYQPAYPLNYVNIIFSLDLSTGNIATVIGTNAL